MCYCSGKSVEVGFCFLRRQPSLLELALFVRRFLRIGCKLLEFGSRLVQGGLGLFELILHCLQVLLADETSSEEPFRPDSLFHPRGYGEFGAADPLLDCLGLFLDQVRGALEVELGGFLRNPGCGLLSV